MKPFSRLLIHRCTLLGEGKVVGQDAYGRDIIEKEPEENIPCRFDKVQQRIGFDESGIDFLYENNLFLDKDVDLTLDTVIKDIKDQSGRILMEGSYRIERLTPVYDSSDLHHFEAVIQKI